MFPSQSWVPLAEIARPHGVRGEVRLRLYNQDSDLLLDVGAVLVRPPDAPQREMLVEGARRANDAILMKLGAVDDRDDAEKLRGALVCVKREDFPPLEDGEFYACDVEDARVVLQGASGAEGEVGRVRELRSYPSTMAFIIDPGDGGPPWEVPLVDTFVQNVDVVAHVVTLVTLEGLERG
jgi:16S rRNA processing protein RimM